MITTPSELVNYKIADNAPFLVALAGDQGPAAGENCTVMLTDVVGFGGPHRNDRDRRVVRRGALEVMRASLGGYWDECISEDRGDGHLIVVPPTVPTARIIERLHRELPAELRLHNHTYGMAARIQLRVAVSVGPVTSDAFGMEGDRINRTARLIEATAFKKAMASTGRASGLSRRHSSTKPPSGTRSWPPSANTRRCG